jgi:hypothetical protein
VCSSDLFRYIPDWGSISKLQHEQAEEIIKHKDFDVNVTRPFYNHTVSLLELLANHTRDNVELIEYLLKQPGIEVKDDVVIELIAKNNQNLLRLFKKYKKIPKHLKKLI